MPSKTNFQVGLSFSADTSQAKKELQSLQKEFNSLATATNLSSEKFGFSEVSKAAAELAANLQTAINVDTGKLDLTKFQQNLQQSGRTIEQYGEMLGSLGPKGQEAFNNLTNAILQAEVPLTRANKLISNLWASFKQTAKYQFTGSIYRTLVSGLQNAYSYAQDLNESLNNIRIVTGQSTEQMAKFAEQANKAASQLSVTTTQYTNGALIYYQQGLNDEEVKARTDVTMKLANASGVSAETASEQLTAIWNNFAKGSENLEYFADVITALGASTASSTSEISEGLEKFAAIGESVGLSYEYAASALATVTATTRQSADVVGTAFKTLFARIQDLELGDTLEDGTTLGKYSQALAAVGVNIKESNGELKAMDQILNEMAGAWSTISKDQQVALAQTVAGTRQYTQLIALMENWGFMQQNLNTAYNSTGTLQEQADIYAESWEAAQKRVKAAAQNLYQDLIDDEFFISLTNAIEKILLFIGDVIDGFGGLKGLLPVIVGLFTNLFSAQIVDGAQRLKGHVKDLFGITQKEAMAFQHRTLIANQQVYGGGDQVEDIVSPSGQSGKTVNDISAKLQSAQDYRVNKANELSEQEQLILDKQIQQLINLKKQAEENDKQVQQEQETLDLLNKQAEARENYNSKAQFENNFNSIEDLSTLMANADTRANRQEIGEAAKLILNDKETYNSPELTKAAEEVERLSRSRVTFETFKKAVADLQNELYKACEQALEAEQALDELGNKDFKQTRDKIVELAKQIGAIDAVQARNNVKFTVSEEDKNNFIQTYEVYDNEEVGKVVETFKQGKQSVDDFNQALQKVKTILGGELTTATQTYNENQRTVAQVTGQNTNKIEENTNKLIEQARATGRTAESTRGLAQSADEVGAALGRAKPQTWGFAEAITKVTSAITSVYGLINSFSNALQIWGDKTKTSKEKWGALVAVISAAGFAIPGVISLIKSLGIIHVQTATEEVVAQEAVTVAIGKTKLALGEFYLIMAAIAAIIGVVVIGIKTLVDEYNKDAIAAEQAAEKAKELANAYKEAKTAAEEFNNTVNNYDEAVKSLEELTVGTEEYKKKVEEANEAAQSLIDKYGEELQGKWEFDITTGQIKIDPKALEELKLTVNNKTTTAGNDALAAKIDANNKANIAALTEITRDNNTKEAIDALTSIYLHNGQNVESALNKLNEEQRELIDKADQQKVYNYLESVAQRQHDNIEYSKQISGGLSKFNQDYVDNVKNQELKRYFQEFLTQRAAERETERTEAANNAENNTQGFINYAQRFGNLDAVEIGKDIINGIEPIISEMAEKNYGVDSNPYHNYAIQDYFNQFDERFQALPVLLNRYREAVAKGFVDEANAFAASIYKTLSDIPIEDLPDELKEILNNNNLIQAIEKQEELFEKQDQKTSEDLFKFFSPNFKNTTDTSDFILKLASHQVDMSNFTRSGVTNFSTEGIDDNVTRALNWYDPKTNEVLTEDLIKQLQKQQENTLKAFQEIENNSFIPKAKEYLQSYDLTPEDTAFINEALTKAFIEGGENGLNSLHALLSSSKDPIGLNQALSQIDFRTIGFEDLKKQLNELGISFSNDALKKYWEDAKESATQTYYLTTALEDLLKTYKEIDDIIGKLDFGGVISEEDYQKLIEYNAALADLFGMTATGQYKFTGTSEDLEHIQDSTWDKQAEIYSNNQKSLYNLQNGSNYWLLGQTNQGENWSDETVAGNFSGDKYNEAAGKIAKVSSEALTKALSKAYDEQTGEIIDEQAAAIVGRYVSALREMDEKWGDKFSTKNFVTSYIDQMAKSSDDFDAVWAELKKQYGDAFKDLDNYKELAKDMAFTNELTSKGLDVDKFKSYYKYLQNINAELENYPEAAKKIALANLTVQKGLDNLNSNFDSYIEGLTEAVGSPAHQQALDSIRQDLADILSVSTEDLENVNENFISLHKDLIQNAAAGNEDALAALEIFTAIAIGNLDEDTQAVIQNIQNAVLNADPGAIIIPVGADTSGLPDAVLDALGMERDALGNWRSQGRWSQRANLKTLQNKSNKSSSGKSKTLKELDDELDRYHYIKKALEDIERELDRVAKVKDRAYGAQHLKYLDQEIQYLQEEVGLQDQYLSQIEGYLGKDRGLMAAYGAQFDDQGNIVNYDQMFAANFNKYANADDSTNWENFKKALSKYEETMDLWQEETEKRADLIREILDKRLEGISYKVDIEVALDDREIALLEHQLNRLDDAAYDTAEALANISKQFEKTEESIDTVTNGIVETLKTIPGITQEMIDSYMAGDSSAIAGLDIEQGQIDLLEQYSDQLLELSDRLKELHDDALQRVFDAFDAWGEKIDDHVAKFEHLNNVLDNYKEIIGLLGQGNLGISNEFMREMRNQQIDNLQGALDTRTQAKDSIAAQLAEARTKLSEAATDAEREDWEKVVDDLEGRLEEATESWQEAWIAALQANKEVFEATMQELVDSFDDYTEELKRYDTAQDRYLETYQQAYELSKLTRDIEGSINDQDSIRAKKELQKLEDKINGIKESGRAISEDELGLLQKEYELRLAEIALEDAQNAKSLVRLTRNEEGNWGYTYTADQDKIAEAEQSYEDKLYEYMRQADTMAESASRAILTLNREMAEALAALDVNAEDYEEQVAAITEFYGQQIAYYAEQYNISVDAIETVAKESAAKYKPEVVDIIESDNSGLQTNFHETVLSIIGDFDSIDTAVSEVMGGIQTTYDETIAAFQEYQRQNQETCELAGTDVEHMAQFISEQFDGITTKAGEVTTETSGLVTDMKQAMDETLLGFGEFSRKYAEKVKIADDAAIGLSSSLTTLEETLQNLDEGSLKYLQKLVDDVSTMAQAVKEAAAAVDDAASAAGLAGGGNSGLTITYKYKVDGEYDPRFGESGVWGGLLGKERATELGRAAGLAKRYEGATVIDAYATGGYTGEWGSSGRLALLHEKELVLNAQDTENILDAVSLVRSLTVGIGQMSSGLGNIGAGLNNLNLTPGTLDQNVSISASFPNVVDHNEIEEAFNNLVNKASQYAFRENRIEPRYV